MNHKQKVLNACDKLLSYMHALEHTIMNGALDEPDKRLKQDINKLRDGFSKSVAEYQGNKTEDEQVHEPAMDDDTAAYFDKHMFP